MSVQGEIIRITEAKTDIASAINEQGYTQVDEDASISTYADAIRANTTSIKTDLSGYLPLEGGTMSGDITMSGEAKLVFGDTSVYNNGNLFIDGPLQAAGFTHATNNSNDYVLLAGGGTKPLSELGSDTAETDPLFQASPAHAVTTSHVETLNDLEAGYITTENEVFQIIDAQDNIVTEFSGDGITTTKVIVGVSDNSPIITDKNITFNKTGEYDKVATFINAEKVITPSVATPFFTNIGGTSIFDSGEVEISSSSIAIEGESYINIYNSTPITFENDKLLSFADTNGKIITTIDGTGITTSTLSANTIKISGGTDDFVLLAGGGYTLLNEITAGLATENYVINKIAEAELAGGDVDLSGLATKDDLKKYLLLEGGTLNGDLIIQRGESALSLSNCELYFNNGGIGWDDLTSVNFYGFDSSLSFDEGGYSSWTSPMATIQSDEVTIKGFNYEGARLCFYSEDTFISAYSNNTLTIGSSEAIQLNADGDGIYLNAPSISLNSQDISASGAILAHGFQITNRNDDYVLLAGGGTKLLSEITAGLATENYVLNKIAEAQLSGDDVDLSGLATKDDLKNYASISALAGYLPLTGGTMTGDTKFNGASIYFDEGCAALRMNGAGALEIYSEEGITLAGFVGCSGSITCTSDINAQAFYETSDARKKDIKSDLSLDKCYDLIDKCQTVIYSLKDQTKEQVGMIAQEIEEFFPEVVATDEEGFKSLAYDRLVVICFKVLKDIIKRLEKLENDGNRT